MRWWQIASALLAGSSSGLVWGTVLVDFEPRWYLALPSLCQLGLLITPFVVAGLCAAVFSWWALRVHVLYMATVLAWSVWGAVRNELTHAGNLQHVCYAPLSLLYGGAALLLLLGWQIGRLVRKLGGRRRVAPW